MSDDPFTLTPTLATKLGSIIVHLDEYTGPKGHPFDLETARKLLEDGEVKQWIATMQSMALLPVKR